MIRKMVHFLAVIGIMGVLVSLITAPAQADTQHGLNAEYYALSDPNTILISRVDPQIAWTYNSWYGINNGIAETFNYVSPNGTPYGAQWSGYLSIPEDGTYTFGGRTDDWGGAQLYIDGQWVDIVYWHSSWRIDPRHLDRDHSGGYDMYDPLTIFLNEGIYPIQATLEEIDGQGGAGFDLDWKRPGQMEWEVVPSEFLYAHLDNTPVGSPCVDLPNVRVCFNSVSSSGTTTATPESPPCGSLPSGFIARGPAYNLTTDAIYTGPVTIAITYSDTGIPTEGDMRLFHCDVTNWEDVTRTVNPIDTVNNIIYGQDDNLSWWQIGDPPEGGAAGVSVFPSVYIGIGAALGAGILAYVFRRRLVRQV